MSITIEDVTQWEANIAHLQESLNFGLKDTINKELKLYPSAEMAADLNLTLPDFTVQYAINLNNELAKYKNEYKKYINNYNITISNLYDTPAGTVLADKAKTIIDNTVQKHSELNKLVADLEKRMQTRHDKLNELALANNLTPVAKTTYHIIERKQSIPVDLNTDFVRRTPPNSNPNVKSYTTDTGNTAKNQLHHRHVKLPVFDGNIAEWPAFYMIFKPSVLDNSEYDDVNKHNILRNHLTGEPLDLIRPYYTDGTQLKTAVERLIAMYGSEEKQYDYLWGRLTKLSVARENPKSLRNLHNELYAIINSLQSKNNVETINFQSVIKSKIPRPILIEVLRSKPKNTTEILEALDAIVTIEESAQRATNVSDKDDKTVYTVKKSQNQRKCKFCQKNNHSTSECLTVRTLEDRQDYIKSNNLCFNCLNGGHRINECKYPGCRTCQKKHNFALCPKNQNIARKGTPKNPPYKSENFRNQNRSNETPRQHNGDKQKSNNNGYHGHVTSNNGQKETNGQRNQQNGQKPNGYNKNQGQSNQKSNTKSYKVNSHETSLMVANAPIIVGEETQKIPVLLDSGADQSFILASFAERANMKVLERDVEINICVFGKDPTPIISNRVLFEIVTDHPENPHIKVEALTVPDITDLFDPIDLTYEDQQFIDNSCLEIANITECGKAVALLGLDVFWDIVKEEKKRLPSGRFIVSTLIGSVVCGKQYKSSSSSHALITRMKVPHTDNFTESNLEEYFEISNIGITDELKDSTNEEVITNFEKTVKINEKTKRIIVSLPWKDGQREQLANNRSVAICRLKQQYNTSKNTEAWKKLTENFEAMEHSNIIEEIDNDPNIGFYIPYGLVYNANSNTTKVRTVFDASSKRRGEISLNNALHQGPSLIPNLLGVTLRLRQGKYLLSGDIEKAFHAVEINKNDRDALRFVWLKDPEGDLRQSNLRCMRFRNLPFGVNCSPFLLSMAIIYGARQAKAPEELTKAIEKMCYVDNMFLLTDNVDTLPKLYQLVKEFFQSIGMNIREFSVNHTENFIKDEDKAKNLDNIKMLGYLYDLKTDTLEVRKPKLEIKKIPKWNKKRAVGEITNIFDPAQIFAPLYLEGKLILREISDHSIKWLDIVDNTIIEKIKKYREKIENSTLKFRRHIDKLNDQLPIEIAIFSDASEHTYGACVYIKIPRESEKGQFDIHLITAKQRIASKNKNLTIPKLELLGILIGVRILDYTIEEMNIKVEKIEIYSDSSIALAQIKNHSSIKGEKQPPFVENRCKEIWKTLETIKQTKKPKEISLMHVPTDQNPADHITRGCESESELKKTNWFKGPHWLANNDHPDHPNKKENNKLIVETPIEEIENPHSTIMTIQTKTSSELENEVIPLEKINNLEKITRITTYLQRNG